MACEALVLDSLLGYDSGSPQSFRRQVQHCGQDRHLAIVSLVEVEQVASRGRLEMAPPLSISDGGNCFGADIQQARREGCSDLSNQPRRLLCRMSGQLLTRVSCCLRLRRRCRQPNIDVPPNMLHPVLQMRPSSPAGVPQAWHHPQAHYGGMASSLMILMCIAQQQRLIGESVQISSFRQQSLGPRAMSCLQEKQDQTISGDALQCLRRRVLA
eukprot:CAMPEP_0178379328 /NCGR_PEP_ID=MMETSP0689_2-20121128/4886_1 /TAXON_ID=160604 /ORGANISM="Amphidinium massartii, Strain CS-259" /LENGTH=212 /DNA_ID=CAMNT_0019999427 /DNA_START=32 /DNA_END=671 /DNA_ORIENTATION=+